MPTESVSTARSHAPESAVAWGAVIAGAVGAAAFSLILILLGSGIGLAVISPWSSEGISAEALGWSTILWVTLVQGLASVLGGYLAGRLRTRWVTVHTDEVFFRDTAHGFLAWAVATLLMATLLSTAITSSMSTGANAAGAMVGAAAGATSVAAPKTDESRDELLGYYVDLALRAPSGEAAAPAANPDVTPRSPQAVNSAEVARVFGHAIVRGGLPDADRQHLGRLLAANTGMSAADAEQRIGDAFKQLESALDTAASKAKSAADEARKASALTALWLVVSLLLGAFLASFAATFGGRLRDSSVLTT